MLWFICTHCRRYYQTYREAENCCIPVQIWDDGYDDVDEDSVQISPETKEALDALMEINDQSRDMAE